jgi:hypothetical protein
MLLDLLTDFNMVIQNPSTTLAPLNDSHIILIPKKEYATMPSKFRLISIINGIQ